MVTRAHLLSGFTCHPTCLTVPADPTDTTDLTDAELAETLAANGSRPRALWHDRGLAMKRSPTGPGPL
ncbi:hypothetical protein ACQEVS_26690 [Streptomyces sp. CA-181903]|uniref:hypothetical protein n=1 Tax=Streptomyces sp. CA-181903 TaxID=3240055 RepID=UPI003D8DF1CE